MTQREIVIKDNFYDIYCKILSDIVDHGVIVAPRGYKTIELHPYIFTLTHPWQNVIDCPIRAINPAFMLTELIWILSASDDADFVCMYNKNMRKFSDDGIKMHGAYGQRLFNYGKKINQMYEVVKRLKEDKFSRQAVAVIFNPNEDFKPTKDVPCNNLLKFTIRNDKLDLGVYVRSQDAIFGLPYDVYHWTVLQQLIANMLKIEVGKYYHVMDSVHLYEDIMGFKQIELAKKILKHYEIAKFESRQLYKGAYVDTYFASINELTTIFYQLREAIEKRDFSFVEEVNDENYKSIFLYEMIDFFKNIILNKSYEKRNYNIWEFSNKINPYLSLHSNFLCKEKNKKDEKTNAD